MRKESLALKALSVLGSLALEFGGRAWMQPQSAAESLANVRESFFKEKNGVLTGLSEVYLMQLSMKAMEEKLSVMEHFSKSSRRDRSLSAEKAMETML